MIGNEFKTLSHFMTMGTAAVNSFELIANDVLYYDQMFASNIEYSFTV